ncbi:hypothetical protein RRG08_048562 [Elysia crispata]|uniref:Uncharacterized protein n=1 Tax=Elysia crispata TaxID=231223 RepID=A0AAE1B4Q9_9GAST|nr:hypothetical protein RRG08_048562 [Elysia crispata]
MNSAIFIKSYLVSPVPVGLPVFSSNLSSDRPSDSRAAAAAAALATRVVVLIPCPYLPVYSDLLARACRSLLSEHPGSDLVAKKIVTVKTNNKTRANFNLCHFQQSQLKDQNINREQASLCPPSLPEADRQQGGDHASRICPSLSPSATTHSRFLCGKSGAVVR